MDICSWNYSKVGNNQSESEDAFHYSLERKRFAICDGASDSIFSGQWASVLSENFVLKSPDLSNSEDTKIYLEDCRESWLNVVPWDTLKWNVKNKAVRGAYSTFLGIQLNDDLTVDCFSIGDCCLFLNHGNGLESFPLKDPGEFGLHPGLIWSGYGNPLQNKEYDTGVKFITGNLHIAEVTDIVIATDAMSKFIMENGVSILSEIKENNNNQQYFDELRSNDRMKNDDVSGIFISF